MNTQKLIFGYIFFIWVNGAYSVSFDCVKAKSTVELKICSNQKIGDYDGILSEIYKNVLATTDNQNRLKTEQGLWLKNIRDKCADFTCLESAYSSRVAELSEFDETIKYYCDQRKSIFFISENPFEKPTIEANYKGIRFNWGNLTAYRTVKDESMLFPRTYKVHNKTAIRKCGELEIRFKTGSLNDDTGGEGGANGDHPVVEVRMNNKEILSKTAILTCSVSGTPYYHNCPDGYAKDSN